MGSRLQASPSAPAMPCAQDQSRTIVPSELQESCKSNGKQAAGITLCCCFALRLNQMASHTLRVGYLYREQGARLRETHVFAHRPEKGSQSGCRPQLLLCPNSRPRNTDST
eukprot:129245-Pelagomonas_calceolata.AAC.5